MAPSPQVIRAFQAMSAIGLSEQQVKPVLKKLVKLYNKDWSLIEAENYRALADAIFEAEDAKAEAEKKTCNSYEHKDMEADSEPLLEPELLTRLRSRSQDESSSQKKQSPDLVDNEEDDFLVPYRPLKRIRLQNRECPVSPSSNSCNPMSGGTSLIEPKVEAVEVLDTHSGQQPQDTSHSPELRPPVSPHSGIKDKGKKPLVSKPLAWQGKSFSEGSSNDVRFKETVVEPGIVLLPKQKANSLTLIQPKDEPFTDDMAQDEVPIAVIHPNESDNINSPLLTEGATGNQYDEPTASHERESRNDNPNLSSEGTHGSMNIELATIPEDPPPKSGESSCLEVASSPSGEVKLSLSFCPAVGRPGFQMPNLDAILKLMEEKCLNTYRIIDHNFSFKNLLGHMCESVLELATNSIDKSQDGSLNVAPNLDSLQKSPAWDAVNGNKETLSNQSCALNGPIVLDFPGAITDSDNPQLSGHTFVTNGSSEDHVEDSLSLVVVQNADLTPDDLRAIHDVNDISRGGERVKISWVNERSRDRPSSFFYISKNIIFKDADVKVRLSSIVDKNCCATCFGDCVSGNTPCACAYETGGKFAYTPDGLIKDDLLEECISMTRNPHPRHLFYCKNCPLERIKNDDCLESCKGHLRRTFIKECWIRCGCHGQCGNRVVQRGLNCSLQVFFTSEGKGWGLRTLDDLPKGAFVCEFVGEVLTNKERHQRKIQCTRSGKCPYLVLLDADWGSKANLRDEEALCLDATNYGNVARFINHRCLDANLVPIPVEVESPDRRFYHVAFFTTRKVDALEELTWDYGIDFDDHDDPVKVFNCICGSKFCRNMTRSNRSRSASLAR
ncbi:probable inactive histone-lysine N-methyltransferase SUVR2 isoform X2 [Argentina anserina]|uniref:probable inactive histone-lysine N-methyltransferase SUVR2 isoform X2 n=1 Tax=Argentina anserina TaxID=57926 RepID=UPI00217670C1|nr:probable inactive histone-lysine N-methyltransferase SUVR2 isoform X2 [Potentilla anserina]